MKIIVHNLATEYLDEGQGPLMLLLHGWQDEHHTFDQLTNHLPGYRMLRLDLPGFGQSEMPPSDWSLDDYASFIKSFLEKVQAPGIAVLVGHSFGGRIALKLVSSNMISVERLVLIASGGIAKTRKLRNLAFALLAKLGKALLFFSPWKHEHLKDWLYHKTGSDYLAAGTLRPIFLRVVREDLREAARAIAVSTLLVWGDKDTETPLEDGKIFQNSIVHSRLEVIPNAGHFVHQEKPEEIARLIREFSSSI